jgi:hypothetical protein
VSWWKLTASPLTTASAPSLTAAAMMSGNRRTSTLAVGGDR